MESHQYHLSWRDWARALGAPLLGVGLIGVLLHLGNWTGMLPGPDPAFDPDTTTLLYKREVSRSRNPAEILLVGDSSCMMGVDAPQLSRELVGHPAVLNLGLIISMGLDVYAEAAHEFLDRNPGRVQKIVLLVTPDKLTNREQSAYHADLWRGLGPESVNPNTPTVSERVAGWLGVSLFRTRVVSHVLNTPLKGAGGGQYGFSRGLRSYLQAHQGSGIDPGTYHRSPRGERAQYFLASSFERESREFRNKIPSPVRLVVGLMPVPESNVDRSYRHQRDDLLRNWNRWLQADQLLLRIPATLPDGLFASGAHLNEQGQRYFTELLAKALAAP